jgi:hypothetical protein
MEAASPARSSQRCRSYGAERVRELAATALPLTPNGS